MARRQANTRRRTPQAPPEARPGTKRVRPGRSQCQVSRARCWRARLSQSSPPQGPWRASSNGLLPRGNLATMRAKRPFHCFPTEGVCNHASNAVIANLCHRKYLLCSYTTFFPLYPILLLHTIPNISLFSGPLPK